MQHLFRKYLDNQCSSEELKELLGYFNNLDDEQKLRELIRQHLEAELPGDSIGKHLEHVTGEVYAGIKKQIDAEKSRAVPLLKRTWFRVAASVVILLSLAGYLLFRGKPEKEMAVVHSGKQFENDIQPGGDRAVLTLADGTRIALDSAHTGLIAQQGSAAIMKKEEGLLDYTNAAPKSAEVLYNTVSTPRGGQYRLVLPDGSKIWLNAASSVYFPNVFTGKERKVVITGEAYFEVTRNATMPFKVEANGMEVEVLGTHFNINAYNDELVCRTTLLEGSVNVTSIDGKSKIQLSPGQQSVMERSGEMKLVENADLEQVMAWKNGKFVFQNDNIESVMRQLERWYDLDVVFQGSLTKEQFVGVISRNVNISQILSMLEKTGAVSFEIRGRKVFVH